MPFPISYNRVFYVSPAETVYHKVDEILIALEIALRTIKPVEICIESDTISFSGNLLGIPMMKLISRGSVRIVDENNLFKIRYTLFYNAFAGSGYFFWLIIFALLINHIYLDIALFLIITGCYFTIQRYTGYLFLKYLRNNIRLKVAG